MEQPLSFKNLTVLDVGCGQGAFCFEIASQGAAKVVGLDISQNVIQRANETLSLEFPELKNVVDFKCIDISQLQERDFDVIISKDAFEHIVDVSGMLNELKLRLKTGGKAYIGFGPLFHSPYGDHTWIREALPFGLLIPWAHLILPRAVLLRIMSKYYKMEIRDYINWQFESLNELTVADFERLFKESDFRVVSYRVNVGYSLVARVFALIGRIRLLSKYFTHNIYCVLEN